MLRFIIVLTFVFLNACSLEFQPHTNQSLLVQVATKKITDNEITSDTFNNLKFKDFDSSKKIAYSNSQSNTVFKISFEPNNRKNSIVILPHHFYSVGLISESLSEKNWITRNEYVPRREYSTNLIAFNLHQDQTQFYILVKNQLPRKIAFAIEDQTELTHYDRRVSTFFTSIYSILLTLVFVNFVFYIFIRKDSYLYYSMYILTALAALFTQEGAIANLEFLSIPFFGNYTTIVIAKIAFPLFWVFAISFLSLSEKSRWDYRFANYFLYLESASLLIVLIVSLLNLEKIYPYYIVSNNLLTLFGGLFALYLSIKYAIKRDHQAIYLAFAWTILMTSVFMRTYYSFYPDPYGFWMFRFTEVALMIEALVLSAGLAHKTLKAMNQRDLAEAKFNTADKALFNQELVSSFHERSYKTIGGYFGPQKKLSKLINSYFISTIEQIVDVNHVIVIPDRSNLNEVMLISNSEQELDKDFFMYENSVAISKACNSNKPKIKKLRYINNKSFSDIIIPVNDDDNQACLVLSLPSYFEINEAKLNELSEFSGEITSSYIEVNKLQQIYKASKMDSLTNVLNRKSIEELFDKMLSNLNRAEDSVAIAFIDIDDFKTINDSLGHSVGDDYLKILCDQLTKVFYDFAYIGRYGGDEFIAIMSNYNKEEITSKFEDLYANLRFKYVQDFSLSVSAGIAIGNRKNGLLIRKELIIAADAALYEAKKQGKNRFVFSER